MAKIHGFVTRGKRRGKALGFPTANIALDDVTQRPEDGIYAAWAWVDNEGKKYPAAVHVGPRPAVKDANETIEAHLLDYDGEDIYGKAIAIEIVKKMREVKDFETVDELARAIAQDVSEVRRYLKQEKS